MASPPEIKITVFGKTDVGLLREHNEDNFLVVDLASPQKVAPEAALDFMLSDRGALFLVCDGMGGAAAGEVASTMAVESISLAVAAAGPLPQERFARRLRRAIEEANETIYTQSRDNQSERGMGTTCTAVGLVDGTLLIGQIGDSRCYVLRGDHLTQTTKDQSLAWQLVEAGAMTQEEAKGFEHANIILQALGVQEKVEVVLSQVSLRRGDTVVVSSDGLHGPVSDDEIKQILLDEPDVRKACEQLIARANEHEGPDNITVVVARFDGPGLPEASAGDTVDFLSYDPGLDPEDPEPRKRSSLTEKATGDIGPVAELRATLSDLAAAEEAATAGRTPVSREMTPGLADAPNPEARPLLTFVLVLLLAALGGALFLVYQRARLPDRSFARAGLTARAEVALSTATPAAPRPPTDAGR